MTSVEMMFHLARALDMDLYDSDYADDAADDAYQ